MKEKRAHAVPLSGEALALIGSGSGLLFTDGDGPLSEKAMLKIVRQSDATATVHGFRSAFRDWVGEQTDFPREVAEAALAHAVGDQAERAYARSDLIAKRRELMAAWSKFACTQVSQ
jgi:integrase